MSGQPSGSNSPAAPKAIASLAKKQPDVTRQGTQRLKFVPVLPTRRKKDAEVKQEPLPPSISTDTDRGRGRGKGGDGRGRGAVPSTRTPITMTASGPFAMGPALAGTSARRTAARSNITPVVPVASSSANTVGSASTRPLLAKQEKNFDQHSLEDATKFDDAEEYSEQDDGVEIVDMENIRHMDWMAPESLRKVWTQAGQKNLRRRNESPTKTSVDSKGKTKVDEVHDIDYAKALVLSDDEEEDELEDLVQDFALQAESVENSNIRQDRLYFFQFPSPFPKLLSLSGQTPSEVAMDIDAPTNIPTGPTDISSAPLSTPNFPPKNEAKYEPEPKVDGVIGHLDVYRNGMVKMRIGNGIVLDVTAATQPSFLQHAVHLDTENKRLNILGEVNRRFVVSPDVDTLLNAMDLLDQAEADAKISVEVVPD